jgi:hypothetical protein
MVQMEVGVENEENGFDQVGLVRELARRAYPDAVAELIDGVDAEAIAASIEPARAAFARLKEQLAAEQPPAPVKVPAGGQAAAVDPDRLPPSEKIRRGIAAVRK